MHSDIHCCLCGAPRRPTQAPVARFGYNSIIQISGHRPLQERRWEISPQLLVNVNVCIWRNGGTDGHTHMCDNCIAIGLKDIKRFVDDALIGLGIHEGPVA